jgi:hypothetical protein
MHSYRLLGAQIECSKLASLLRSAHGKQFDNGGELYCYAGVSSAIPVFMVQDIEATCASAFASICDVSDSAVCEACEHHK